MRYLLCLAFAVIAAGATAQDQGSLSLYIYPTPKTILIDGEELKYTNTVQLDPGFHTVKAWYPHKELLDTNILITAGKTVKLFHSFPDGEAYSKYRAEVDARNAVMKRKYTVPLVATVAAGGALAFTYLRGVQLEQEVRDAHYEYQYAGYQYKEKKAEFENLRGRYRTYYYAQYVEYAALAVSSYFLVKGIKWMKANPEPELADDHNPLTLEQVGFAPNMGPVGGYSFGLVFSIN